MTTLPATVTLTLTASLSPEILNFPSTVRRPKHLSISLPLKSWQAVVVLIPDPGSAPLSPRKKSTSAGQIGQIL